MTVLPLQPARRARPRAPWLAIGAAVAAHVLILGTASVFGADLVGIAGDLVHRPAPPPVPDLATTCSGDVLLATSARAMMCLAPWRGDVAGCGDELTTGLWIDLSGCRRGTGPIEEVSMISPRAIAKVKSIDPERLLEEMQHQPPPPSPSPSLPPPQPQTAPPPPPQPPAPSRPQQVIENVRPDQEQEPDNARYLAEYSTRVDKQSVSRGADSEPMVAKAKPEELRTTTKPPDDPSSHKPPSDRPPGTAEHAPDVTGPLAMRKPGAIAPAVTAQERKTRGTSDGLTKPTAADGLAPQRGTGQIEQQHRDAGETPRGEGGAGGGAPQLPDLDKSKDVLERIAGGGSVDHLDDVADGDETALNAKRFVHASFFNRMGRQVHQNWDPGTVLRRIDPDGSKNGVKTRVTGVRVSLNAAGALVKISVMSPSGVSELDEEAMHAFKAAAPFPNPPVELAKNGLITFDFGFYVELGAPSSSWRVLRQ